MTHDAERVIVIGSGPAGAMAALTLVEQGLPVTLLESGIQVPEGFLVRAMGRNVFRRRPQPADNNHDVQAVDDGSAWVQSFVPGGLSNYWVGAVPRFSPDDFSEGERLHERYRWPLNYADLLPYYERVERLLRIVGDPHDVPNLPGPVVLQTRELPGGWQKVARCAVDVGQGLTPMPLADGPNWMFAHTAVGFNSYTDMVRPLVRRPNFDLRLGAHAVRIEWCGDTHKATSVVYVDRATGSEIRLKAGAIVVAAGPLASTKLLLNSSCADFPDGLGNVEGLLGKYLHEHLQQWCPLELQGGTLPRMAQAAYLTRSRSDQSAPLLGAGCTIGFVSTQDKLHSLVSTQTNRFGVLVFGTMVPIAENRLSLQASNTDEFGLPNLDLHLVYTPDEVDNLTSARAKLTAILESAGYPCSVPRYIPEPVPGGSVHYGGTVRMHASPEHGMLNAWNRLHAVDNVVVADASAFTTGVEKNPTLTVMALAARASEHLAADLKAA